TPLFEANGDCIGWICIPNTAVNYPVMFTPEEPQKYLRKNFEGEYSVSGVPFLDGASTPECDNLIIYGHNMKNGTMFSDITQYRDKAYFEEHPYIELETADGLKVYQVFALHRQIYVDC
ncbi:MAG: class B sortase, partial [Eubacterium sp.]|nr:class B sortase [Eubacterium sp.]